MLLKTLPEVLKLVGDFNFRISVQKIVLEKAFNISREVLINDSLGDRRRYDLAIKVLNNKNIEDFIRIAAARKNITNNLENIIDDAFNDLVGLGAISGQLDFKIGSNIEMSLKADELIFNAGATDVGLAWSTSGQLTLQVDGNDELVLQANKLAFFSGSSSPFIAYGTDGKMEFGIGTTTEMDLQADKLTFNAGAKDVGLGWATSGKLDFTVGSNIKMDLQANALTFNAGATDVGLDWTTSGRLNFKIGSTNEMGLTSNKLSFFSGVSPTFLQWSTDGKLEFGIFSAVKMDMTSSGLNIVDACRASMFRADTSSTGVAGTNTWGGTTLAPNVIGTRPSLDKLPLGYSGGTSEGWIKIHVGTTEAVIPYWKK